MNLPSTFQSNIQTVYGEKGSRWLDHLPAFLKQIEQNLSIKVQAPFQNLSFNFVAPVTGPNDKKWVIKVGVDSSAMEAEMTALKHFNGEGAVRIIDSNLDEVWMLIQQCAPGTMLFNNLNEFETIPIAIDVAQRLWKPFTDNAGLNDMKTYLRGLKKNESLAREHFAAEHYDYALTKAEELVIPTTNLVVLHGDLHYENILQHEDTWLAIDPKGVIGEPEFELASFFRNSQNLAVGQKEQEALNQNLNLMSELTGFDRQRILDWAIIQSVLWVGWLLEDGLKDPLTSWKGLAKNLFKLTH